MRLTNSKTRARQTEIKKIVNVISTLEIDYLMDHMEMYLRDLGHASISESTMNSASSDFLYLENLFC